MHPSQNTTGAGQCRVRTPTTYAHSPYAYRTPSDDMTPAVAIANTNPHDDHSARRKTSSYNGSWADGHPNSHEGSSSSPIQVSASLNVQPRYGRNAHSPLSHQGSYNRSAFPTSPYHDEQQQQHQSAFAGGESAPHAWAHAPPCNNNNNNGGNPPYPLRSAHPGSAPNISGMRRTPHSHPLRGSSGVNTPTHQNGPHNYVGTPTYAPSAFNMPPAVAGSHTMGSPPPAVKGYGSHPSSPMGLPQGAPLYNSNNSPVYSHHHNSLHGQSPNSRGPFASMDNVHSNHNNNSNTSNNNNNGGCSSSSVKSYSSASSIRDDLPLCPNDDACALINDRKHQHKFAHTCRLFPCYHGHIARHAKLFRHASGQISQPEGVKTTKMSTQALASVNFSTISPDAPNAYRIYVSHGPRSYEIFGDWSSVKVHTFKRYLHQVYHILPSSQILVVAKTAKVMDDDLSSVRSYSIEEDSVIELRNDTDSGADAHKVSFDDL